MRIVLGDVPYVILHQFAENVLEAFTFMKENVKMFVHRRHISTSTKINAWHVASIIVLHVLVIIVIVVKEISIYLMEHVLIPALMVPTSLIITMGLIVEHVPSNAQPATPSMIVRPVLMAIV